MQNVYPYARAAGGLYAAASNVTCGNAVLSTSDAAAAAAANTTSVTGDTVQSAGIGKGVLIASAVCDGANPGLYKPVSQYDPIAWGAAWMYWATGDIAYYNDVSRFLTLYGAAADVSSLSAFRLARSMAVQHLSICHICILPLEEAGATAVRQAQKRGACLTCFALQLFIVSLRLMSTLQRLGALTAACRWP